MEEAAPTEAAPVEEEHEPMVILTTRDIVSLDPMYTQSDAVTNRNMFITLLWFNDQGELEPQLAESVERVDDLTWEIKLQEGYTLWDGTPITAEAVKFTYGP